MPAIVMATPAHAELISGTRHYHITQAFTPANQRSVMTVTVTVHNGGSAFQVSAISISGYTFSNGTVTIARTSPVLLPVTIAADSTQVFTFTVTGSNNGGTVVVGTTAASFTTIPAGISIPKLP